MLELFMRIGNRFFAQPARMGVPPQLYAATAPQIRVGQFFSPDGPNEKKGHPISEELTGVRADWPALSAGN